LRVILIVLDSVGIGSAPDAAAYDDAGSATLQHTAQAAGGLSAPTLQRLGLGNIPALLPEASPIQGVPPAAEPSASFGAMQEVSEGKDTITGHWELAGLEMVPGFTLFPEGPPSFPDEIIGPFREQTGRPVLGNLAASGTGMIQELGDEALRRGAYIVYTSADSVFQIAAHTGAIPLEELYEACRVARRLCDPYRVGRVIARPFVGEDGRFTRTRDRRDFSLEPAEPTVLQRLTAAGVPVYCVGKLEDIFARRGITESNHTGDTASSQHAVEQFVHQADHGLIFANFIDFDMLYGHRRDPEGYARAIEQTDDWLAGFLPRLAPTDTLIITADHGNDPTFKGTDHTREYVPLLVHEPGRGGESLGVRLGFYDVAQSLARRFGIEPMPRGRNFLEERTGA
jgi:phosphopentomutase